MDYEGVLAKDAIAYKLDFEVAKNHILEGLK